MFNFVSLLKYKRQMTGNKLCKPAQRKKIKHSILIITEVIKNIILTRYLELDDRFEWRWQRLSCYVNLTLMYIHV